MKFYFVKFTSKGCFFVKRSKVLSILLAVMMILSTMSCLSVVSLAANLVASGYTPDSANAENPDNRVIAWEFYDDGVLYLYDYPGTVSWTNFSDVLLKVVLKKGPKADECKLTEIPDYAFYDCKKLAEVDVSAGVKLQTIGAYAFNGCTALEIIDLAQGIINIGDYAFYGCTALKNVKFSYNLADVGKNVFKGCTALTNVSVPNGVQAIGYGMFEDCSALAEIELPDSVVSIGELAFSDCSALTNIVIPDSVTTVGRYAFDNCSSLKSAYIGHNAENIGEYAFSDCVALTDVEIAAAMRTFSEGMFMGCSALSAISLDEGVTKIGKNAFKDCSALAEINLPSTLKVIGDSAFDATALKTVAIPADVETIENGAFTNCKELTAINVDSKNDAYYSIDGVLYDVSLGTLILCPAGKEGKVTVSSATTAIANDAFIGCDKLEQVTIPASVEAIESNAFNGCAPTLKIEADCNSFAASYAKTRGIELIPVHVGTQTWQETLAPTCLTTGTKELVCSECGYVYETATVDALGHDYDDGVITTKATCDTDGVMTFTCTRPGCSASYTEVIPATKHNYDTGKVLSAATCDTDGTMRYSCQNPGCLSYYDEVIEKTGHNMDDGKITTPATCDTDGEIVYKCQNAGCLHKVVDVIPATGHNYDDGVVTTPATCTEKGVKTYTCQNAGCTSTYTEDIDAIGHDYVALEVKKATCLEDGKIQHTCANCGDIYTEATKGEHVLYSTPVKVNPTCTQAGKEGNMCAVCRQFIGETKEIPATGHTYVNGTCTGCGDTTASQAPSQPGGTVVTPEGSTGGDSSDAPAKEVPARPKMQIIKNEIKGISVTWSEVEGATGYRVYRRGAGQSWKYLCTVKDCKYLDTTAASGAYWRYTVRAVNENGFSAYENGIYIKRVDTPHIAKVTNTVSGVKVTWSAVDYAKTYRVYRRGAGESWKYLGTVKTTNYVDKTAKSGTLYRYTVRAVSGYLSAYESGLVIRFVDAPELKAVSKTANGVKVTWGEVPGADSYRVYRRGAGQSWVYVTTVTGTSYVDSAVKNAEGPYRYTVRAVDSGRYSSYEKGLFIRL